MAALICEISNCRRRSVRAVVRDLLTHFRQSSCLLNKNTLTSGITLCSMCKAVRDVPSGGSESGQTMDFTGAALLPGLLKCGPCSCTMQSSVDVGHTQTRHRLTHGRTESYARCSGGASSARCISSATSTSPGQSRCCSPWRTFCWRSVLWFWFSFALPSMRSMAIVKPTIASTS